MHAQVEKVVRETEELKKRQATPDSPEALSCIPSLQLSDIPKEAATIPSEVSTTAAGATLLTHDLFTNNVLYADVALPLTRVPSRLLPLLPLFCRCVLSASFLGFHRCDERVTGGRSRKGSSPAKNELLACSPRVLGMTIALPCVTIDVESRGSCRSLLEMGTETESFIELTERIDRTTGGLSISPSFSHKKGSDEPVRDPLCFVCLGRSATFPVVLK